MYLSSGNGYNNEVWELHWTVVSKFWNVICFSIEKHAFENRSPSEPTVGVLNCI